ncbi:MAG: hypothetical protein QW818_02360 [Candidatus Aenigmatarchaeota archaeon]|nr:hypothetical protein [Candidatus Aenigmarchaeota archaeon]
MNVDELIESGYLARISVDEKLISKELFSLGLKERRHLAVGIVLEQLNEDGKLESM